MPGLTHVIVNGAGASVGDADERAQFTAAVERIVPQARLTIAGAGADIGDLVRQGATVVAARSRAWASTLEPLLACVRALTPDLVIVSRDPDAAGARSMVHAQPGL